MANQRPPQTPKEHLQQMNILHLALLGGQLMIFVMLYFFLDSPQASEKTTKVAGELGGVKGVFPIVYAIVVSTAFQLYNKRKKIGQKLQGSLMEKLAHYRVSFILRAAFIEGANLLVLLLYFFFAKTMLFLVMFASGIVIFLLIRPTANRIIEDYQLSGSEQRELSPSHF